MSRNAENLWPMRMRGALLAALACTSSCSGQQTVGSVGPDAAADTTLAEVGLADAIVDRVAEAALADAIPDRAAASSDGTLDGETGDAATMGGHDATGDATSIDARLAEAGTTPTDAGGTLCAPSAVDGTRCTGPGEPLQNDADICLAGRCIMPPGFPGCQSDADCARGGCLHGFPPGNPSGSICMGTAGIPGAVACGDEVLSCSTDEGCSITDTSARVCGRPAQLGLSSTYSTCDGPSDCPAGQDCCVTATGMGYGDMSCFARTAGGASSGCPSTAGSVLRVCDPRDPIGTCPQGLTCKSFFFGTGAFTCSP